MLREFLYVYPLLLLIHRFWLAGKPPVDPINSFRPDDHCPTLIPPIPRPMITSLSRTASPFSLCRAEWCRRALTTSAYAETSSSSPMPPKQDKKVRPRGNKGYVNRGPPRIFVRPWDGVPSMLDGFAMLRGIENNYGKVKSFKFIRVRQFRSQSFLFVLGWTQSRCLCPSFLSFRTGKYPLRTFHTSG